MDIFENGFLVQDRMSRYPLASPGRISKHTEHGTESLGECLSQSELTRAFSTGDSQARNLVLDDRFKGRKTPF